jgi:protein AroM
VRLAKSERRDAAVASKIGAITIGQSPRIDVVPEIIGLCGGVEFEERGALDGLSDEEIQRLAPEQGEYVLVTRLKDGRSVHIAKKHILTRMQLQIDDLIQQGVEGILLLCTGEFPGFRCSKPILYPQRLLQYFVASVAADKVVGVLSPDASQIPQSSSRWRENGVAQAVVEPANPYGDPEQVLAAGKKLKQQGAELLVMDCIGYTCTMKQQIKQSTGLPVVLPRTIAARAVAELFGVKG